MQLDFDPVTGHMVIYLMDILFYLLIRNHITFSQKNIFYLMGLVINLHHLKVMNKMIFEMISMERLTYVRLLQKTCEFNKVWIPYSDLFGISSSLCYIIRFTVATQRSGHSVSLFSSIFSNMFFFFPQYVLLWHSPVWYKNSSFLFIFVCFSMFYCTCIPTDIQ